MGLVAGTAHILAALNLERASTQQLLISQQQLIRDVIDNTDVQIGVKDSHGKHLIVRPHSKSLSSGRFQVFRHRRTSLWLAGVGFQAADAADEQVLSGHRRGLLHNTHICRCLEAYSSRGAFFSELQSGRIQAACSSSSRRRFFISMMRQQL